MREVVFTPRAKRTKYVEPFLRSDHLRGPTKMVMGKMEKMENTMKGHSKSAVAIRNQRERIFKALRNVDGSIDCRWCGTKMSRDEFTRDHLVPQVHGGKNGWANIVPSCRSCNNRKGSSVDFIFVPPNEKPFAQPGTVFSLDEAKAWKPINRQASRITRPARDIEQPIIPPKKVLTAEEESALIRANAEKRLKALEAEIAETRIQDEFKRAEREMAEVKKPKVANCMWAARLLRRLHKTKGLPPPTIEQQRAFRKSQEMFGKIIN